MTTAAILRGGGGVDALCDRTDVSSSQDADVYGSWTQLVASMPYAAGHGLLVSWRTGEDHRQVLQLAVGAAAAEQPIATLAMLTRFSQSSLVNTLLGARRIPVRVPAGARVSARLKTSRGGVVTGQVALQGMRASPYAPMGYAGMVCLGIAAGPQGVSVTSSSVATTYGAWSEITSATTVPGKALAINGGLTRNNAPEANGAFVEWQVGVGASGSEVALQSDILMAANGSWPIRGMGEPVPVNIPAGSRIAMRCRSSVTSAAFDGLVHLFY